MLICSACSTIHTIYCSLLNKVHSWTEVVQWFHNSLFTLKANKYFDLDGKKIALEWQWQTVRASFLYIYALEKWRKNINCCQILDFLWREQRWHTLGIWEASSTEISWLKKHWCHTLSTFSMKCIWMTKLPITWWLIVALDKKHKYRATAR